MIQLTTLFRNSFTSCINLLPYLLLIFLISCTTLKDKKKWKYSPFSKAVIQVNVIDDPPIPYFFKTTSNTLIPRGRYESESTIIEQSGKYNHSVEIDCPSIVRTNFGEEVFTVLVFPDDTTCMNIDFIEGGYEITFSGDTKAINTYYLEKKLEFGVLESYQRYYFQITTRSGLDKIKQTIDSFTTRQLVFLDNYKPIKKLTDHFIQFEKSEIRYEGITQKIQASNSRRFNLPFSDEYFNFLDLTEIDNPGAVFSSSYLWFLDKYFELKEKIEYNSNLTRSEAIQESALKLIDISNRQLTGYTKDVYNLYNFCRIIPYRTDEDYIDSLAVVYQIKNYQPLLKLIGATDEKGYDVEKLIQGKTISEFYASDEKYNLTSVRDYQDYILLIRFYSSQEEFFNSCNPEFSKIGNKYIENENIKLLNICLDSEIQPWLDSISNNRSNIINLIVEGSWNRKLKKTYGIAENQVFVLLNQENIYVDEFENLHGDIQERIDSLLRTSKYHEIEIL